MAVRIDLVRNRIQQFESNPLNMGTDAANTGLEMLRGQLDQAVREQQKLNQAMDAWDIQAANEAYLRLQQTIGGTERNHELLIHLFRKSNDFFRTAKRIPCRKP